MKSPWPALVIAFVALVIVVSSPTIFGFVLSAAFIGVLAVLVIAGLAYIFQHMKPPGWLVLVYVLAWLVVPGVMLAVSIVAGICAGVAFFAERMSK